MSVRNERPSLLRWRRRESLITLRRKNSTQQAARLLLIFLFMDLVALVKCATQATTRPVSDKNCDWESLLDFSGKLHRRKLRQLNTSLVSNSRNNLHFTSLLLKPDVNKLVVKIPKLFCDKLECL